MSTHDEEMMQRALSLSLEAKYLSPPNPWVGCVIVKNGRFVGMGATKPVGSAHAEIVALEQAGKLAEGATVYVTLEPCCHFGRTPPCTRALIEAKVTRVVIALQDPDVNVRGRGIQILRTAGIEVVVGILEKPVSEALAPYLYHRQTGLTYCIGKAASSIDGRIAAKDGTSKWISSKEALTEVHRLRAESQAIIIGSKTAIYDSPSLTVRHPTIKPAKQPLRIVLDSQGSLPSIGPLFDSNLGPTLIATTNKASIQVIEKWQAKGAEVIKLSETQNGVDLNELVKILGQRNIIQALVEGGGTLLGAFLEEGLLQRFHSFIGPCFLGNEGLPLIRTKAINTLNESIKMQLNNIQLFGNTVNINYSNNN